MKPLFGCSLFVLIVFSLAASQQRGETPGNQNTAKPVQPAQEKGLRAELRGSVDGNTLLSPNSRAHLHFILFSNTDGLKVYQDWNRWGYRSRSFIAQGENSKSYEITPVPVQTWTRNFPSTDTINKGDALVTDVYLCDWRVSPKLPSSVHGIAVRLTGRFTIQDAPGNKNSVWTGKLETSPMDVTLDQACVAALNAD